MKRILALAVAVGCAFSARAQTNSVAATNAAPRRTIIESEHGQFDMATGRQQAIYSGHVRVTDPQMRLACEWLAAEFSPSGGRINRIVAETNVVIDFTDDRGQTNHATCDRAVYVFDVKDGVTNELVTLTGHAQVENPQAWLTGEPIYLDLISKTMHADNQKMILREHPGGPPAATNAPPVLPGSALETNLPPARAGTPSPVVGTNLPEMIEGVETNGTHSPKPSP